MLEWGVDGKSELGEEALLWATCCTQWKTVRVVPPHGRNVPTATRCRKRHVQKYDAGNESKRTCSVAFAIGKLVLERVLRSKDAVW